MDSECLLANRRLPGSGHNKRLHRVESGPSVTGSGPLIRFRHCAPRVGWFGGAGATQARGRSPTGNQRTIVSDLQLAPRTARGRFFSSMARSYVTISPGAGRKDRSTIAVMCMNTGWPPPAGVTKPNPRSEFQLLIFPLYRTVLSMPQPPFLTTQPEDYWTRFCGVDGSGFVCWLAFTSLMGQ